MAVLKAITDNVQQLTLPPGIDGAALLQAFAWVESSGGINAVARHEDAFCPNQRGTYAVGPTSGMVRGRHSMWGCLACCSYGPWQVLYHTAADLGFVGSPTLLSDPAVNVVWAVTLLNRIVKRGAADVRDIADAYNSGTHRDANRVPEYTTKLGARYDALVPGKDT
jgi:hypothetical protein